MDRAGARSLSRLQNAVCNGNVSTSTSTCHTSNNIYASFWLPQHCWPADQLAPGPTKRIQGILGSIQTHLASELTASLDAFYIYVLWRHKYALTRHTYGHST